MPGTHDAATTQGANHAPVGRLRVDLGITFL